MSTTSRLLRSDADTAGAARTYLYGVVRRADVRAIRSEGAAAAAAIGAAAAAARGISSRLQAGDES